MSDKVQKIREEIEKIKTAHSSIDLKESNPDVLVVQVCTNLLSFIDSIHEETVSEDLEEASKEWLEPQLDKSYVSYGEGKMMELTHFDGYAMLDAIEFGAKWQEQQMMAKAIDGKLFRTYDNSSFKYKIDIDCDIRIDKYKDGEKVKVIIVKED